jgi:hypothetical protein
MTPGHDLAREIQSYIRDSGPMAYNTHLAREIQSYIRDSGPLAYNTHLAREIQRERTKDVPYAATTIYQETPQSDPEELERNIKLWKQWEAEASCKHMLALEKKANRVECELGQLYKEQQLQEELNAAVEQNKQSRNMLSSYWRVRVAGLSGDTCHEQRGPSGYLKKVFPFEGSNQCP